MSARILRGDCLEQLPTLPDNSVHAIITDPPYGLSRISAKTVTTAITHWTQGERSFVPDGRGFGGAQWDRFVPPPAVWDECLRVLKPGGWLLSFAGTRTQDLMGLSLRLAGFEIRDEIAWVYVSGMPKTMNLALAAEKVGLQRPAFGELGTALKPAHEPILVCQKPVEGTIVQNLEDWGAGALNIDVARIPTADMLGGGGHSESKQMTAAWDRPWMADSSSRAAARARTADSVRKAQELGRFPSNLIFDEASGILLDLGAGKPLAKMFFAPKPGRHEKPYVDGKTHETVKPLDLLRYLVKLVVPARGVVLDPFAGSGTTIEAAVLEDRSAIGIEREADHIRLIEQRLVRSRT